MLRLPRIHELSNVDEVEILGGTLAGGLSDVIKDIDKCEATRLGEFKVVIFLGR